MTRIEPLSLRFVLPEWAQEVPSPPHDALSAEARRQHLRAHPRSYLGVTRSLEDAEPGTGASSAEVLQAGRASLEAMLADGVFGPESSPTLFIYRLEEPDGHRQTGLVCGVATGDYDSGTIRIHERINETRATHLADHLRVVGAQSSPIALAFRSRPLIDELIARTVDSTAPFLDVVDQEGLRQQLWEITDRGNVDRIQSALGSSPLYLIDGHHRAAAASADRDAMSPKSREEHLMLCALFPYQELRNQAFHRILRGVDGQSLEAELGSRFATRGTEDPEVVAGRNDSELALAVPVDPGSDNPRLRWILIDVPFIPGDDSRENIDPVRLGHRILEPVLGIDESNADPRLSYRPGLDDLEAIAGLSVGRDELQFLMRPVPMSTLMEVSDQGLVMPPKSTYFTPKVRSGLFVRLIPPQA